MPLYGTENHLSGKGFACRDCGKTTFITADALSMRCASCGNIQLVRKTTKPSQTSQVISEDAAKTDQLRYRYQSEWLLWSKVVENFHDFSYHQAYIHQSVLHDRLALASERYKKHLQIYQMLPRFDWQVEICNKLLRQIDTIAQVKFYYNSSPALRSWWQERSVGNAERLVWLVTGMVVTTPIAFWFLETFI